MGGALEAGDVSVLDVPHVWDFLLLEILEQQHGDQCYSNLDAHSVGGGSHEGLDFEVLLKGLEEELDLPTLFVDCGDGGCCQFLLVRMTISRCPASSQTAMRCSRRRQR